jgi:hypothetical protein
VRSARPELIARANLPVFEALYKSVKDGSETRRSLEFNSRKTYREDLQKELDEIDNQEIWRAGKTVRGLRVSRSSSSSSRTQLTSYSLTLARTSCNLLPVVAFSIPLVIESSHPLYLDLYPPFKSGHELGFFLARNMHMLDSFTVRLHGRSS